MVEVGGFSRAHIVCPSWKVTYLVIVKISVAFRDLVCTIEFVFTHPLSQCPSGRKGGQVPPGKEHRFFPSRVRDEL